jgi:hypothetical protein
MPLDRAPEWKERKDSAEAQEPERIKQPDRLTGIISQPDRIKLPDRPTRIISRSFFRRTPAELEPGEERMPFDLTHRVFTFTRGEWAPYVGGARIGEFGSPRERDWDVEAGLARLRSRLERLRSDPAEQRRMDELLAEIPPPESFVRIPPTKEPPIELSPRSAKGALDTPLISLPSKDERGRNRIRGKDEFGGRGKLGI